MPTMDALEAAAARSGRPFSPQNGSSRTDTLAEYTTADDIVSAAARAGVDIKRKDIAFAEHKVNGKTKGSAIISCRNEADAGRLAQWLHNNDFQGKRINPTFVDLAVAHPFKPAGGPRLNTQILLSHGPTNAHGGVNFNRVKPARLAQQAQAIGMGWPTMMRENGWPLHPNAFAPVEY